MRFLWCAFLARIYLTPPAAAWSHTCEAHEGDIWAVAFSPSTPYGASVGEDRTVRVFHTEQKKEIAALKAHTGTLYAVTFSRDGRQLATAGRDGTARIWDTQEIAKP